MNFAYLSLGSNVDKERCLPEAVRQLAVHGRLVAASRVYETPAIGNPDDPSYFNAAVILETELSPAELKQQVLQPLEHLLGRVRSSDPNAPRTIDVDISLFNSEVLILGKRRIPDPENSALSPHCRAPGRCGTGLSPPRNRRNAGRHCYSHDSEFRAVPGSSRRCGAVLNPRSPASSRCWPATARPRKLAASRPIDATRWPNTGATAPAEPA